MAPQDGKPRNNARKAAARALQRQHPEMSYLEALAQVTGSTGSSEATNPLHIQTLLKIVSARDIADRHKVGVLDMAVPVGIGDSGDTVTVNMAHWADHPDGKGPHGAIAGPGALNLALAVAVALRANIGAEQAQVAFLGTERHCRTAAPTVDHVGETPWQDWLRDQLNQRSSIANAAQVTNLSSHPDLANRLVVFVHADGALTVDEAAALQRATRTGRSLGLHVILVCPDSLDPLTLPGVGANLTFIVSLTAENGSPRAALALAGEGTLAFTPAQFGDGELARWITAARQAS